MPHCPACGVWLKVGHEPWNTRGAQIHEASVIHRAAEGGHRLLELTRPGYGSRWRCSCGAQDKTWQSRSAAFRGWLDHAGQEVAPASVPKKLGAADRLYERPVAVA